MKNQKSLLILGIFTSILFNACNSQTSNPNKDNFNFKYLSTTNKHIEDSVKLKLNFYFNNYSLSSVNYYLENIENYKKEGNTADNVLIALNAAEQSFNKYVPSYLKRVEVNNEYQIDSLYYEKFEIPQLLLISENYYSQLENLRLTRTKYDKNINSIIKFHYDLERPMSFKNDNRLELNIGFLNISSKDIKSFTGILIITNTDNENLLTLTIDSDIFPNNIRPNPLNAADLESWEWRVMNSYYYSGLGLETQLSEYKKMEIYNNRNKLIMTFLPKEIFFKDGSSLFQ